MDCGGPVHIGLHLFTLEERRNVLPGYESIGIDDAVGAQGLPALARSALSLFVGARLRGRRGSFYGITRLYKKNRQPFLEDLPRLFDLLAQRKISPRIAQSLPLLDARKANERLEADRIEGKLVLVALENNPGPGFALQPTTFGRG